VIGATPAWPLAGVSVTVRSLPLPPKTMLPFGTSPEFAELPETVRLPADVSRSSTVKSRAGVAVSDTVLVGGMLEITGAVFTGRTVTMKLVLFDRPPYQAHIP